MNARRLIINADDFGYSNHTVEVTIYCFNAGILSSASLMPNMPAFNGAVDFALNHPEFSYGLHLCLTDEYPISKPAEIPTLVSRGGSFWPTRELAKRAFTGRISAEDIYKESMAQLVRLRQTGIKVTHIDSHGHVHKFPAVLRGLRDVLKNSGVLFVRPTQNLFYHKPPLVSKCYNNLANLNIKRLGKTTDYFLMVAGSLKHQDYNWFQNCLEHIPSGITEIGIHPGLDEQWRRLDTLPVLKCGRSFVEKAGIELVGFGELEQITDYPHDKVMSAVP